MENQTNTSERRDSGNTAVGSALHQTWIRSCYHGDPLSDPIPSAFSSQTFWPQRGLAPPYVPGCQLTFGVLRSNFLSLYLSVEDKWSLLWLNKNKQTCFGRITGVELQRRLFWRLRSPLVVCLMAELLPTSQISAQYAAAGVRPACSY